MRTAFSSRDAIVVNAVSDAPNLRAPSVTALRANDRQHAGHDLMPGEAILWEGRPSWIGIAQRILHGDLVVIYFALLAALALGRAIFGYGTYATILGIVPSLVLCATVIAGWSWMIAKTTHYIVTPHRIVLRYGYALPRSLSLPWRQIASLSMTVAARGRGDIALRLCDTGALRYLKLWPHARPFFVAHPQPALRDIADVALVATSLTRLLKDAEQKRDASDTTDMVKTVQTPRG